MRRLILRRGRERGAVAVVVAVFTVVLMCFAALAVDLGAAYSDRQQLQNGADAGALAYAQSCQSGACVDKTQHYAVANKLDGIATGAVVSSSANTVTVETRSTHTNWFGGIVGVPTTPVSARASVSWGYVSGGETVPLAFSWCAFYNATGGWSKQGVPFTTAEMMVNIKESACTKPAHAEIPGGFGWLDGANCSAEVHAGNWVGSDTGNVEPNSCSAADFAKFQGKQILLPIFEAVDGTGNSGKGYQIKGLAAFTVTGYCFGPKSVWQLTDKCPSDKRIRGFFSSYTDISGNYDLTASADTFGISQVRLSA